MNVICVDKGRLFVGVPYSWDEEGVVSASLRQIGCVKPLAVIDGKITLPKDLGQAGEATISLDFADRKELWFYELFSQSIADDPEFRLLTKQRQSLLKNMTKLKDTRTETSSKEQQLLRDQTASVKHLDYLIRERRRVYTGQSNVSIEDLE